MLMLIYKLHIVALKCTLLLGNCNELILILKTGDHNVAHNNVTSFRNGTAKKTKITPTSPTNTSFYTANNALPINFNIHYFTNDAWRKSLCFSK